MKYIYALFLVIVAFWGCQDVKIGCLDVSNAEYMPDTMLVRKELGVIQDDWDIIRQDKKRMKAKAPWVTTQIQGVIGTAPIQYSLYEVTATDGGDAEIFKKELKVRGGGILEVPFLPESPNGRYTVSLKVEAGEYSAIIEDAFTFVIRQK